MKNINIKVPKGVPWLDYTTSAMLKWCPRKYFWRMIQHVTSAEDSPALVNGTAYHEAKAVYLQSRMNGATHLEAKAAALAAATPIMQTITAEDPKRNLTVALKTLDFYFDFWRDSDYTPLQVEIGFAIDLQNFFYVGRIDSKETCHFGKIVMETKTTTIVGERWQFRGDPNAQIDGYVAADYILTGEMPYGGCLDVIPIHDKKNINPFRILAPRSVEMVDIWLEEIQEWFITLQRYKDSGIFPRDTDKCMPLVGFSCEYRLLCKMYPQPHRCSSIEIPGDYKIEKWAPIEFTVEEEEKK